MGDKCNAGELLDGFHLKVGSFKARAEGDDAVILYEDGIELADQWF